MLDSLLFEELLLKNPNKEVISFGAMYEKEVTKRVQELLKDSSPFQMAASISILFYPW